LIDLFVKAEPVCSDACEVMRHSDGTVLVRVPSGDRNGRRLPDAVFTFRSGDPQYSYWAAQAARTPPHSKAAPA
jgi:hypothetical protein